MHISTGHKPATWRHLAASEAEPSAQSGGWRGEVSVACLRWFHAGTLVWAAGWAGCWVCLVVAVIFGMYEHFALPQPHIESLLQQSADFCLHSVHLGMCEGAILGLIGDAETETFLQGNRVHKAVLYLNVLY